ncbi:MAG TPA: hypothetical protein VGE72_26545 [Azospirillum sp.]
MADKRMVPMRFELPDAVHPALRGGVARAGDPEPELGLFMPEGDLMAYAARVMA